MRYRRLGRNIANNLRLMRLVRDKEGRYVRAKNKNPH